MAEKDWFLMGSFAACAAAIEALIETHPQPHAVLSRFETTLALWRASHEDDKPHPEYELAISIVAKNFRASAGLGPR